MIMFTKINSVASLSQGIISLLILSGVKLRQLQHWYGDIVDQDIEFGSDLLSKILILVYWYGWPNSEA